MSTGVSEYGSADLDDGLEVAGVTQICRLCSEENSNGTKLFTGADDDVSSQINTYLPIKISEDSIYPTWICPGCHLQVESTVEFFELVINGQEKLRNLYQQISSPTDLDIPKTFDESTKKEIFPSKHELRYRVAGIEKRRRGRPSRPTAEQLELAAAEAERKRLENGQVPPESKDAQAHADDDGEPNTESGYRRTRRRTKLPERFSSVVAGKELDRVLAEEGVIDQGEFIFVDMAGDAPQPDVMDAVIGHLQDKDGTNIGDLIQKNVSALCRNKTAFVCDICNKCFLHESRYVQHRRSHYDVMFECTQCLVQFKDRAELQEHQKDDEHVGEGVIENLEENIMEDLDGKETDYQLSTTLSSGQLADAEKDNDEEEKYILDCCICNEKFTTENARYDHIKMAHGDPMLMEISTEDTTSMTLTNAPVLPPPSTSIQTPPSPKIQENSLDQCRFCCNTCGKIFRKKQLLQRHQVVHTNNRPYVCSICPAAFKAKPTLLNHQILHTGDKTYECNVCQQMFTQRASLTIHLRMHAGKKPYECKDCGKFFTQNGNLVEHMRVHTGERPFECTLCGKRYKTSSQRRLHMRCHDATKPFQCSMCPKTFRYNDVYRTHLRRHQNVKPFSCDVCQKGFSEHWALRKHQRIHTGEKPYQCNVCSRSFSDCSNLSKHKKTHGKVKKITKSAQKSMDNLNVEMIDEVEQVTPDDPVWTLMIDETDKNLADQNASSVIHEIEEEENAESSTSDPVWKLLNDGTADTSLMVNTDSSPTYENVKKSTRTAQKNAEHSAATPADPVWKILNDETNDTNLTDHMIYVTYQDPSDPSGNKTMLVTGNVANGDFSASLLVDEPPIVPSRRLPTRPAIEPTPYSNNHQTTFTADEMINYLIQPIARKSINEDESNSRTIANKKYPN